MQVDKSHGSPWDRGAADAYYGRPPRPHRRIGGTSKGDVALTDPAEIAEYFRAYEAEPNGRKTYA